jgi:hypothetical protein
LESIFCNFPALALVDWGAELGFAVISHLSSESNRR